MANSLADVSIKALHDAILQSKGAAYLPDEIVSLEQLDLKDFPKTASGKVQKSQLAAIVREFRLQREKEEAETDMVEVAVLQAWQKAIGIPHEHLDLNEPTIMFADSIAIMRVRDTLRKKLHITISPEEMVDCPTIRSQIRLARTKRPENLRVEVKSVETGPPSMEELTAHFGGGDEAKLMKQQISQVLTSQGFNWENDVSAVVQSYDALSVLVQAKIIHTWNFAIAVTSKKSTVKVKYHSLLHS